MKSIFNLEDRIYIAKYYGKIDTSELTIGLNASMGKRCVEEEIALQKAEGVYEKYKNMPNEEYEKICCERERKKKRNKFFSKVGGK